MIIQSPRALQRPIHCAICGEPTRRPYYQFIGSEDARALCADDAQYVSEAFTTPAVLLEAVLIIRATQRQIGGSR